MSAELDLSFDGENPRSASTVYLKLKAHEFEAIKQAYLQLGGDEKHFNPLTEQHLGHNNGPSQVVRALANGSLSTGEIEAIDVEEKPDNHYTKCEVALLPSELDSVDRRVPNGKLDYSYRNVDTMAKKLRQGVIVPFVDEVSR
jgi:hypothetical protein